MTDYPVLYRLADLSLLLFHGSLVVFNACGWAWRRTRRLHLCTILLTMASWFGLGLVYGWGYCPLTDWHWRIKRALGETGLPASWMKYYLDHMTGLDLDQSLVDAVVVVPATAALALSACLAVRDRQRSPRTSAQMPENHSANPSARSSS